MIKVLLRLLPGLILAAGTQWVQADDSVSSANLIDNLIPPALPALLKTDPTPGGGPNKNKGQEDLWASFLDAPTAAQLRRAAAREARRKLDQWDERLLLDIIPIILGQRGCNENGTLDLYKEAVLQDSSNDDIVSSTPEQIIERSGFAYERHESLSGDGYWTKLIRLRNPLVAERHLKQPPVMFLQPNYVGPSAFIWASSSQHHPEDPDDPDEQGERSWNRSLAFVLANRGYDVWLAESRGLNSRKERFNPLKSLANSLGRTSQSIASLLFGSNKNMTLGETLVQLTRAPYYWTYSFDEIIHQELRKQIEKVLEVSEAANITLVSYSFASMVALPFIASQPRFARERLHNLVLMAPILSNRGANTLSNYLYEHPCLSLPDDIIAFFGTGDIFTRPLRHLFIHLGKSSSKNRYKVLKFLLYLFQGPSAQYRTFLEPAVFGHLFEPTSLLQLKHFCQQVLARRYQRYHFGHTRNLLVYGQHEPPVYNTSQLQLADWMLIGGQNDNLGTSDSFELLLEQTNPKPSLHIQLPGYAHLDLVAAVDNDIQVNLPILGYLERKSYYRDRIAPHDRR